MNDYRSHYKIITQAIWEKYPDTTIIASGRWMDYNSWQVGHPCVSTTSGTPLQRCDLVDEHHYDCPDFYGENTDHYDSYNRSWPKVFVGEYAANSPGWIQCSKTQKSKQSLQAALAEAGYMMGFEHNADVVKTASFAPLFCNVRGTQWPYNLINFNASDVFGIPSYYVQKMFSQYLGVSTLTTTMNENLSGVKRWAVSSVDSSGDTVVIKLLNYGEQVTIVSVQLQDFINASSMQNTVLTASEKDAQNTLDQPKAVHPDQQAVVPLNDTKFTVILYPWSLTFVKLTFEL